jgi:hypothetical protein
MGHDELRLHRRLMLAFGRVGDAGALPDCDWEEGKLLLLLLAGASRLLAALARLRRGACTEALKQLGSDAIVPGAGERKRGRRDGRGEPLHN